MASRVASRSAVRLARMGAASGFPGNSRGARITTAVAAVVLIVTITFIAADVWGSVLGLNTQVARDGRPEHEKLTAAGKPAAGGVTSTLVCAGVPGATEPLAGLAVPSVK